MDFLSQEIIDNIVEYLAPEDNFWGHTVARSIDDSVAGYACISRYFQHAIERLTFKRINVVSTELMRLRDTFQSKNKHRRMFLKELCMTIILPEYDDKYRARMEREREQNENNTVFSEAITVLFNLLNNWESPEDKNIDLPRIKLDIGASSYSDYRYWPGQFDDNDSRSLDLITKDIRDARWSRSYLTLDSLEKIKEVQCVSWFRCRQHHRLRQRAANGSRSFAPASIARLATKMPKLECMDWDLRDDERWTRFVDARQQRRHDFAKGLFHLPVQHLTSFYLEMSCSTPNNHSWQNASALHPSEPEIDWLSIGLHHISQAPNLRTFMLDKSIALSPTVLWPGTISDENNSKQTTEDNAVDQGKTPYWPSLRQFLIRTSAVSPDGSWLYDGTPSERPDSPFIDFDDYVDIQSIDSNEPDILNDKIEGVESGNLPTWCFRDTLRTLPFVEWIKAMTLSIQRMPKLRSGIFTMTPAWQLDEREAKDFRVDVEFKVNQQSMKEWVFHMGVDLKYSLDPEVLQLIDQVAGKDVNVQVTSKERELVWHPLGGWTQYPIV